VFSETALRIVHRIVHGGAAREQRLVRDGHVQEDLRVPSHDGPQLRKRRVGGLDDGRELQRGDETVACRGVLHEDDVA